jgi:hypothetical protein
MSDGVVVTGAGSACKITAAGFYNAMNGITLRAGASAELSKCRFEGCGRGSAFDSAIGAYGRGTTAVIDECSVRGSETVGCLIKGGASLRLSESVLSNIGENAVLAHGRGTRVELLNSIIEDIACGAIQIGQSATLQASETIFRGCDRTFPAIAATYLGTEVTLVDCKIEDCAFALLSESEAEIFLREAPGAIQGLRVARRKGHIDQLDRSVAALRSMDELQRQETLSKLIDTQSEIAKDSPVPLQPPSAALLNGMSSRALLHGGSSRTLGVSAQTSCSGRPTSSGRTTSSGKAATKKNEEIGRGKRVRAEREKEVGTAHQTAEDTSKKSAEEMTLRMKVDSKEAKERMRKQKELNSVKAELGVLFDHVAECLVLLDANSGGSVSLAELERGLRRLGINFDSKKLRTDLGFYEHSLASEEMDDWDFICKFIWHPVEAFPDSNWKTALVEARRNRRRIMDRFCKRSDGIDLKGKQADEIEQLRKKVETTLRARAEMASVLDHVLRDRDFSMTRKKGLFMCHAGKLYRAGTHEASAAGVGTSYSKAPSAGQQLSASATLESSTCSAARAILAQQLTQHPARYGLPGIAPQVGRVVRSRFLQTRGTSRSAEGLGTRSRSGDGGARPKEDARESVEGDTQLAVEQAGTDSTAAGDNESAPDQISSSEIVPGASPSKSSTPFGPPKASKTSPFGSRVSKISPSGASEISPSAKDKVGGETTGELADTPVESAGAK